MIRLGIIGCGWAGRRHYRTATDSPRAEVLAVVDTDTGRLSERQGEWDVEHAFADYRKALALDDLDGVVIALPHDLHREVAVRSAEAGLHILCEKPIAISVADADAMIDSARENDVILMVAESAMYEKRAEKITDVLEESRMGIPVFATWNDLHKFETWGYEDRDWLNDPERAGGGHWITRGIHIVSPLRGWFRAGGAGDVDRIFAAQYRSPSFEAPEGIEADLSAFLVFEGGQSARINMGVEIENYDRFNDIRIHGTGGSLVASEGVLTLYSGEGEEPENIEVEPGSSFRREMEHFISCIENEEEPITSGVRERNSLAVIQAGYRSLSEERVVEVDLRAR